jgi:hypothetical protein
LGVYPLTRTMTRRSGYILDMAIRDWRTMHDEQDTESRHVHPTLAGEVTASESIRYEDMIVNKWSMMGRW